MSEILLYTFTYLGTNILVTLTHYGVIPAASQTLCSGSSLVLCKYTLDTSFTTAALFSVATTTPIIRHLTKLGSKLGALFSRKKHTYPPPNYYNEDFVDLLATDETDPDPSQQHI